MSAPEPFGLRLDRARAERGPLCVGIDPHPGLLAAWGLSDDVTGLESFCRTAVDALAPVVAAIKPQAAFFERHGAAGVAVLERVIARSRDAGALVVVDAKRGDIGSTMSAYADAFCREGSPLAGDAVTVSPFLGTGSLDPVVDLALANGRGVFVLALTSNPEGPQVQHAVGPDGVAVAAAVARDVRARNESERAAHGPDLGDRRTGSVGMVVGATVGDAAARLDVDLVAAGGPLLVPGLGAQGAGPRDVAAVAPGASRLVLPTTSRGVLRAGPDATALATAAREVARDCRLALGD